MSMILTYFGASCFKIQFGDTTIAVNPISKDSKKFSPVRFGAGLCLISTNDPDMNGAEQVSFGDKEPFVIQGPGEYERGGIFIRGLESSSQYGGKPHINTIYTLNVDSMNLCFLGALGSKDIPREAVEQLEEIDILFVPVGPEGILSARDGYALAVSLEPKVIIPVAFGDAKALEMFLKEAGEKSAEPVDKLTLKKKDLEGKEGAIMILKHAKDN